MNHNDRLLFNRLMKRSNCLIIIAIITLLSILIGVIFPNPYSYNIAVSGFAIALIWGLIRNYKNKKTYTEEFSTYQEHKTLPKTGDNNSMALAAIGVSILTGLGVTRRKRSTK